MTAFEAFELTSKGGGGDFARVIALCRSAGSYCLIGGLAVNCYVEPVYTLDADFVVAKDLPGLLIALTEQGFSVETHKHSVNVQAAGSQLRIQFTTDDRYYSFPARSEEREVLGLLSRVACLEDTAHGKLWAYTDPQRRLSKRKKDELDLIRLAEAYPPLKALYPAKLLAILAEG